MSDISDDFDAATADVDSEDRNGVLISVDGEVDIVLLPMECDARLDFLKSIVGGCIEVVSLSKNRLMVINEDGKGGPHMVNQTATVIAHEAEAIHPGDYIAGPAIIFSAGMMR